MMKKLVLGFRDPSRHDPGWEEKLTWIFILSLFCGTSKVYKTFWGTTKKCENKNLS